ncbi:MAG: class I SAM-dependent methyltransferase [Anaerolineales bacterium]
MNKLVYELLYRVPFIPKSWIFGPLLPELVELVESGRIAPGRAIDLGCGVGVEAIYLATNGFDVTGVDFSPTAIKRARNNAREAGVEVRFVEEDLTDLRQISGAYDLLVDVGALDDLDQKDRDSYMQNVIPLTHPGSLYLLMCFEKELGSEEVEHRFGEYSSIEKIASRTEAVFDRGIAVYLMTRR